MDAFFHTVTFCLASFIDFFRFFILNNGEVMWCCFNESVDLPNSKLKSNFNLSPLIWWAIAILRSINKLFCNKKLNILFSMSRIKDFTRKEWIKQLLYS